MSTYFLTSVRPLWDTLVLHMTGSSLLTEWWKVTNSQKYSFFAPPSLDRVSRNSRSAVTSKKRPGSRTLRKSAAWLKSDTAGVYTSVSVTLTLMIACCVGDVLYLRWIYMFMNSIKKSPSCEVVSRERPDASDRCWDICGAQRSVSTMHKWSHHVPPARTFKCLILMNFQ